MSDVPEARNRFLAIQGECDRDGLRFYDPATDKTKNAAQRALNMEAFARDIQKSLGIIYEHAAQGLVALEDGNAEPEPEPDPEPEPEPEPDPDPPPQEDWGNLLSQRSGLTGIRKWYTGPDANGIDLFVPRFTVIRTPRECVMSYQQVPGGPTLIGEMTLQFRDGSACRFRHIVAMQEPGYYPMGTPIAYVYDPSMDMLHWPSNYPTPPDGYQHLDLAIATSVGSLNPAGGAGGNYPAYRYLWIDRSGLPNIQVYSQTPGPVEGMNHLDSSVQDQWHSWMGTK